MGLGKVKIIHIAWLGFVCYGCILGMIRLLMLVLDDWMNLCLCWDVDRYEG
jgi:hypothetical protein